MKPLTINKIANGDFAVVGDLTFASLDKNAVKNMAFLTSSKEVSIDLCQVVNTDSAGLALMIEWIKYARSHRTQLRFHNIPKQLRSLAKLSRLDTCTYFEE